MAETKVEELPAPVPNLIGVTKPQGTDLSASQQKQVDEILAHFATPDYELPVKESDKKLKEEEKFWLVGPRYHSVIVAKAE